MATETQTVIGEVKDGAVHLDVAALRKLFQAEQAAPNAEVPVAQHENALGGIANFKIADIPVGSAIAGGLGAAVLSGLAARFLPGQTPMLGKAAAAFLAVKFASRWVGRDIAVEAAKFLVYDALRDFGTTGDAPSQSGPFEKIHRQALALGLGRGGGGGNTANMARQRQTQQLGLSRLNFTNA